MQSTPSTALRVFRWQCCKFVVEAKICVDGEPGKQHPDGRHVLFDRWWRGLALKDFDIRGDRDRFNVFEVLIPGALGPGQELLDRPVVGGSCVRVADRHRKKLEELFPG